MDHIDRKILSILQEDDTIPISQVAEAVGLSTTPCWRRIQNLEAEGIIIKRVALLDPEKMRVGTTVFLSIKTSQHNTSWLDKFADAVKEIPEVVEFFRMSGDTDYLLRIVVPDIAAYDAVYKKLISIADLSDATSSFAMERIKCTTALPTHYVE